MNAAGLRSVLRDRLPKALERRGPLLAQPGTGCLRLVNAQGDGLPELTVDRFEDVLIASLYQPWLPEQEQVLVEELVHACAPRAVYLKRRPKEARQSNTQREQLAPEAPAYGPAVEELWTQENGLSFLIRPGQGLSVGLYLDMRDLRAWLRQCAAGGRVLNCFAYTCGFSVAARAGGAAAVLNVDLSRRVLDWGRQNALRNGQPAPDEDYLAGDVFDWLVRLGRKHRVFERVVLDPPSFAKGKRGVFSSASDYADLVALAAPRVSPGGLLLACCNTAALPPARFRSLVQSGLHRAGRAGKLEPLGPSAIDFPSPPGQPPALKVLACHL